MTSQSREKLAEGKNSISVVRVEGLMKTLSER